MQIEHGDILEKGKGLIFIPVNQAGVLGAGLAKQFADKYPNLIYGYKLACMTGAISTNPIILDQFVMFPTKVHWSHKSSIQDMVIYLDIALLLIGRSYIHNEISVPKLGCGLGGVDWNEFKPILVSKLETFERRYQKTAYLFE